MKKFSYELLVATLSKLVANPQITCEPTPSSFNTRTYITVTAKAWADGHDELFVSKVAFSLLKFYPKHVKQIQQRGDATLRIEVDFSGTDGIGNYH